MATPTRRSVQKFAEKIKVLFHYVGKGTQFSLPVMMLDEDMTIGDAKKEAAKVKDVEGPFESGVKIMAKPGMKFTDIQKLKDVYPDKPVYPDKIIQIHHVNHSTAGPGVLSIKKPLPELHPEGH
ncbi:hypothetical protein Ddc_17375 [Ditylenchus destructor]|nr:hypothetical protein Ddc_17375 [Ditylenchus destructor]